MTTGREHSSFNLFHGDREVVTKRGWLLNHQIGCFERWCLAQDCFLWGSISVTRLSVLPLPSCLAQEYVEWIPCRQGWLEDLWDRLIDFVSCVAKPELSFWKVLAFILAHPPLFLLPNKAYVVEITLFFQLPSTTAFCGSALILGHFWQPGNFLFPVQCTKQMDARYWGNNKEVCFGRICGT